MQKSILLVHYYRLNRKCRAFLKKLKYLGGKLEDSGKRKAKEGKDE